MSVAPCVCVCLCVSAEPQQRYCTPLRVLLVFCCIYLLLGLFFANVYRYSQISMDVEDFPRGKRRRVDTNIEVTEAKGTSFDKELFSEVNCDFAL